MAILSRKHYWSWLFLSSQHLFLECLMLNYCTILCVSFIVLSTIICISCTHMWRHSIQWKKLEIRMLIIIQHVEVFHNKCNKIMFVAMSVSFFIKTNLSNVLNTTLYDKLWNPRWPPLGLPKALNAFIIYIIIKQWLSVPKHVYMSIEFTYRRAFYWYTT